MERLILPDGSAIGSGVWGQTAILSICRCADRNEGSELTLGSACCGELTAELFALKKPHIPLGSPLALEEDGFLRGTFLLQDITRKSKNRWELTALDPMCRFDRELADFPWGDDTALSLLLRLCDHCGVETDISSLPGGDTPVPPLKGYSARQILRLLGQVAGRYFYIDEAGKLCAGWYDTEETIDNFQNMVCAEYETAPIQRVLLRQTKTDAGWAYPQGDEEKNTLILQGNPIFATAPEAAERIFRQISTAIFTPFTCRLLPGQEVRPGCKLNFTDLDGKLRQGLVMRWEKRDGIVTIRCVGSPSLQRTQAVGNLTLEGLEGQILQISRAAQGLSVSHQDLLGNVGSLQLSLAGVESRVTSVEASSDAALSRTTQLSQDAQGLSLAVSRLEGSLGDKTDRQEFSRVTEHFLFDAAGMTIQNSATGMGIRVSEEQVQFLGDASATTAIFPDAMTTTRLSVEKRLDMGNFSYLPRTNGNLSFRFTGK